MPLRSLYIVTKSHDQDLYGDVFVFGRDVLGGSLNTD